MTLALVLAQGPISTPAQPTPAKACHDHGSHAPNPKPRSSSCCLTGHDSAIPRSYSASQTTGHVLSQPLPIQSFALSFAEHRPESPVRLSGSPPGFLPLRV